MTISTPGRIRSAVIRGAAHSPGTDAHYSEWLDVDSFIDHHILNIFTKNPDGFRLSGYFFKEREGTLEAGPIWDFDRTMGCSSDDRAADPTWWDASNYTSDTTYYFTHGWYEGLFDDPEFRAAYWARMDELLNDPLSIEHVHEVVDRMADELAESAERNFDHWSDYPPRGGELGDGGHHPEELAGAASQLDDGLHG